MGHSTKSLRSSPLRGGKSREAVAEESDSGVESPVLRIRGVVNLTQDGTLHERHYHCQSAASAHDRGHGCTQAEPAYAAQPHLKLQAVRRLAQTLARYGDTRRGAAFSTAPHRERCEHL